MNAARDSGSVEVAFTKYYREFRCSPENDQDTYNRACKLKKFLTSICEASEPDSKLLVIGHNMIFNAMLCDGVNKPIREYGHSIVNPRKFKNAELTEVRV